MKFMLNVSKSRKNGVIPLVCRITHKRKHSYFNTQYKLKEENWDNQKECVKKNYPNYKRINLHLSKEVTKINSIILDFDLEGKWYSAQEIKQAALGKSNIDFISFAVELIHNKQIDGDIVISTFKKYEAVIKKFSQFCGGKLNIEDVTSELLKRYSQHLKTKHGNSINTIAINMKCLRVIVLELIRKRKIKPERNPFLDYKFKFQETERKFLYPEETAKIWQLKTKPKERITDVKEIFLFCYETGLRIGDALFLQKNNFNGVEIHYYCHKTKEFTSLPLTKKAIELLSNSIRKSASEYPFAFPFIDPDKIGTDIQKLNEKKRKTALINKYLKKIDEMCGLGRKLRSHMARHSLATNALTKGLSYAEIQSILGHSNVTTTQLYAKTHSRMKLAAINKLES